jgi:hypothetical protein
MVRFSGEMKPKDLYHTFSKTRLIRTELSTLIGLLIKKEIDYSHPGPDTMQSYLDNTEALLDEMHHAIASPFLPALKKSMEDKKTNPFDNGMVLREPIFYGGESAYAFQYRELSLEKYARDDDWLRKNKGFSIKDARDAIYAVGRIQMEKIAATLSLMSKTQPDKWTVLPGYTFTAKEIADYTHIAPAIVSNVLHAFALPDGERNQTFSTLNDFNIANATPLLRVTGDTYVNFQIYSLVEALYEAPFYWMGADKTYVNLAMLHRGRFTEVFAAERLALVFGKKHVYSNVDILASKGKKVGEIDVLVIFGNRAIVLQAKSKRLTLEARRGNDSRIRDDFKKSIQDSCDQAYGCAKLLGEKDYILRDANSRKITLPVALKQIYVLCLISDHYPALSFQAQQFLAYEKTEIIPPPFVLDVFTLDAITEMLSSPLQLLSYVDRRVKYTDKLIASHELTILSYHLKRNLWLGEKYGLVLLEDDISADLDLAMVVRRENIPGKRTPDGILTRFAATVLGKIVKEIESKPSPPMIDFGLMLLMLNEETVIETSQGIEKLSSRALRDGKNHDLTLSLGRNDTGLIVHCNNSPIEIASPRLEQHCHLRKYKERAHSWFGICVRPGDASLRFGVNLQYKWEQSDKMDFMTKNMLNSEAFSDGSKIVSVKRKLGRNDPCPCGSGKKYKKCCGNI